MHALIRAADHSDLAAIEACVESAYDLYVSRIGKPPAPMLDDYTSLISQDVVSVAVVGNRVVGLIVMWPATDHFYVDNIAVHPDGQGRGIGRRLLGHAYDAARRTGHTEVRLYTNEKMTENLDFYPRQGFVETHRVAEAGYNRVYFSRYLQR